MLLSLTTHLPTNILVRLLLLAFFSDCRPCSSLSVEPPARDLLTTCSAQLGEALVRGHQQDRAPAGAPKVLGRGIEEERLGVFWWIAYWTILRLSPRQAAKLQALWQQKLVAAVGEVGLSETISTEQTEGEQEQRQQAAWAAPTPPAPCAHPHHLQTPTTREHRPHHTHTPDMLTRPQSTP